jgi:CRP/FNR family cyclic AMP-dependent transcriptional regulator
MVHCDAALARTSKVRSVSARGAPGTSTAGAMTVTQTMLSGSGERVRVFEEVPELLQRLGPEDAKALTGVTTQMLRLERGLWQMRFRETQLRGHLGLLVLDGLLSRQVTVGDVTCAELLGGGDVLRPWTELESGVVSIPAESRWQVVLPAKVAVLDARFTMRICRWPEVMAVVADRLVQRARWLSFHLAVCQIVGIEVRLLIVFWHFADRWGRVTPAGVKLPLPLSHGLLAATVGSRRPTVTTALRSLREQGLVTRTEEGWILSGEPPVELHELRARVAAREPKAFGAARRR